MKDAYVDIFKSLDLLKCLSKTEVLNFLAENGEYESSIAMLSEQYARQFGIDPIWRYPLSDGWHSGAFIVPVREGFMYLPYDEVDSDYFEIVLPEAATMLDSGCCERFMRELKEYADTLLEVLAIIQQAN